MRQDAKYGGGFTLIELLVVMMIIGLLSALSLAAISRSLNAMKVSKAKTEMVSVETALKAYFTQYNEWHPAVRSGELDMAMVRMLWGENENGMNPSKVQFMEFNDRDLSRRGFLDPWGRPFKYAVDDDYDGYTLADGQKVRRQVTLWSEGPNLALANDDVLSWKLIFP